MTILEKYELTCGFEEDFIELLKENFEMTLREYLENSKQK
jgi:predicted HicB family RNase H-like nuclease